MHTTTYKKEKNVCEQLCSPAACTCVCKLYVPDWFAVAVAYFLSALIVAI